MIDTTQFETFMSRYQDMVYGTASRLLGNPSEAQDISQTVFLKAFQHFAELENSATAGGWLKTVTTNLCLNHLSRYRYRWRFFSELAGEDAQPETFDLPAVEPPPDTHDAADRNAAIESALARLPASQRIPIVLYHFDNLSYQEIADRLGYSLSKVKTEIFRGRQALAKKLKLFLEAGDSPGALWSPGPGVGPRRRNEGSIGPLSCCLA